MPYERKGKCIFNKETGEKKGCSTSVGKAKKYMRALYAAEKGIIKEEESELSQAIKDRAEDIYQAMKATALDSAVDRYKADAEDVLRGRAMNVAKKQVKMKTNERLKEIIRKQLTVDEKFSKEYDNDPALKGKQKKLPDELQSAIIKKSVKEELDYEGEMAKSELRNIIQNAQELMNSLDDDTQLEAWVQSKLTKANDYLNSVTQYLGYQNTKQGPTDETLEYYID
jgi:cation transport regulator ChaB